MSDFEPCVRFWGTRGSIPTPGAATGRYGGNTTCIEVWAGDTRLIFDAGSGIRNLGLSWDDHHTHTAHLLFTHMHWDHIQGFPFFGPAYHESTTLHIYCASRDTGSAKEILTAQMEGACFPIPMSKMKCTRLFHDSEAHFSVDDFEIKTIELPHPGGCLGYRASIGDYSVVFATDCELLLAAEAIGTDGHSAKYPDSLIDFFSDANLLILDCQYTDGEYDSFRGWGHNSASTVADFANQVQPRRLALTHHDPGRDDDSVDDIVRTVRRQFESAFATREGLVVSLKH